ncbi:Imm10 family immunity protein [Nonomuraea sp. NPDC050790]|uniref:Imm10 family immunity protein n=1 Tax=Nonomuraea sp. NPDC050790 TaxID=3364371 RepID=UPI0037941549
MGEEPFIAIGEALKAAAPEGWEHVEIDRVQLGTFSITTVVYEMSDGSRRTLHHADGLDEPFQRAKSALYEPGKGTWLRCRLDYGRRGGSYNLMAQTFSQEPPFGPDIEVPPSAFADEQARYPRTSEHTPPWMPPSPLPPARAGEMVARTAGRDDDSGLVTFGLAEDVDGNGRALIFMAADDDAYCITREHGAGTTYGGVTLCDLTYGRLTLHFTEDAARELDVDPVMRIDLHIDDDGVEILRRSLREILLSGPPDQHPHHLRL